MKRLSLALFLAMAATGPAFAQDPVMGFSHSDAAMNAARAQAQATLPLFLKHTLDASGQSTAEALLKVGLPTESGSESDLEHIWVEPFARNADGSLSGLLANEPVSLGALRKGDQVYFTAEMVSDWHLNAPSGRFWGSFTSRVMHAEGAFGDTPFDTIFEPDPVPADWR